MTPSETQKRRVRSEKGKKGRRKRGKEGVKKGEKTAEDGDGRRGSKKGL